MPLRKLKIVWGLLAGGAVLNVAPAVADQVINDDLIVDPSLCVGTDCVNGEPFGFDTIRLKENNLRIRAFDTSNSSSFPTNDWQITFNDSANGGLNKFSIDDLDHGRTPFTIEAGAPSHSLYVEDGGNVGFGTSTPVVELHTVDGNTPTLRLQQDGSQGWTPQTWDIAGNEANFFIRDVTNGGRLPFRIQPGAPQNSLYISPTGEIGLGTQSPQAPLELHSSNSYNFFRISATGASPNTAADITYTDGGNEGSFRINIVDGDGQELELDHDGNLMVTGSLTASGSNFPDYVFAEDYQLMPLEEVSQFIDANKHLPNVPSAETIDAKGLNMTEMQKILMEKVEELTLYAIEQQKTINLLLARLDAMESAKN